MKIIFERIFLKDIKKLDSKISLKLKEIFIELEKSNSL
jgi:mRNA-degrading endonuclease RelE of RelBE toxin-antitoxin system